MDESRERDRLGTQAGSMEIVGEPIVSDLDEDFAPFKSPSRRRRSRV
jgi:hypothetical protein